MDDDKRKAEHLAHLDRIDALWNGTDPDSVERQRQWLIEEDRTLRSLIDFLNATPDPHQPLN